MYSVVLMAAMTSTAEAPSFGDIWAKHCFWECCLPARYGWVPCGPGYSAIYPASYTSCNGWGGGWGHGWGWGHGCSSCYGCGGCYGGCGGCWGGCYGCGCGGCYGYGWNHACGGGYYNCYGGGPAFTNPMAGVGYSGFGAYGNFGNYNSMPYVAAPVYDTPAFGGRPLDVPNQTPGTPIPAPTEPGRPIKDIKPMRIEPLKTFTPSVTPNTPTSSTTRTKASVVVRVPEKAKVFIDGNLMQSTSTERKFTSPTIAAGESFYYTIRVVIEKDGKEVADTRRVTVKAGETSRLSFDNLFDRTRPEERTIVDANKTPVR